MINPITANQIKKEKNNGALNSALMKKYQLSYPDLREILDNASDIQYVSPEEPKKAPKLQPCKYCYAYKNNRCALGVEKPNKSCLTPFIVRQLKNEERIK